jgi:hypothetical protein
MGVRFPELSAIKYVYLQALRRLLFIFEFANSETYKQCNHYLQKSIPICSTISKPVRFAEKCITYKLGFQFFSITSAGNNFRSDLRLS